MKKLFFEFLFCAFALPVFAQVTNVNIGSAPTGAGGDTARVAFTKVNDNFTYLQTKLNAVSNSLATVSNALSTVSNSLVDLSVEFQNFTNNAEGIATTNGYGFATEIEGGYIWNTYLGGLDGKYIRLAGQFDANTFNIENLNDPQSAQDAATKNYVDTRDKFTLITATNLIVGSGGGTLTNILTASATLDLDSVNAGQQTTETITVTGANPGDAVFIGMPEGINLHGAQFSAWVYETNTVIISFKNDTSGTVDVPEGVFKAVVFQF